MWLLLIHRHLGIVSYDNVPPNLIGQRAADAF